MGLAFPLDKMTTAEKLQAIEALWDDLSRNTKDVPSPPWHEDVLTERQRQLEEGQAKFVPLDEFRRDIQEEIQ